MKPLRATRRTIPAGFRWFSQVGCIEGAKVERLRLHLRAGGRVPPVVLVEYADGALMPVDGHHRTAAHDAERLPLDAWVVPGERFEALDIASRDTGTRADNLIDCGGVPALLVADEWRENP